MPYGNNKSTGNSTTLTTESKGLGVAESSSSVFSSLEGKLDDDTTRNILSFLTLVDFSNLSQASSTMNDAVSLSSHLYMCDSGIFRTNPVSVVTHREFASKDPDTAVLAPLPTKSKDDLQQLMMRFKNLSVLDLRGFGEVGDDLIGMLNRCPSARTLKSVALRDCELGEGCTQALCLENLTSLTLTAASAKPQLTTLLEHSGNVKSLTYEHSSTLTDGDTADLGRILGASLEELNLNYTKLSKPVGSFPKLTHASFAGGLCLTNLSKFDSPNLTALDLTYCIRLSDTQIEKVVRNSPALETLITVKCSGVHSLNLESNSLRRLDVGFTHNLRELKLRCPALENLDTSCCSSLKAMSLDNLHNLQNLDLGGLVQLRALRVTHARSLIRLDLRSCRRLDRCQIDCPNLRAANLGGCKTAAIASIFRDAVLHDTDPSRLGLTRF